MASHANRICPPACCPNVQRDDKILRLSASWCSPPEKIAPPQTIAPQKVFLGGQKKIPFSESLLGAPKKQLPRIFKLLHSHETNSIQDQFGSKKNCAGKNLAITTFHSQTGNLGTFFKT